MTINELILYNARKFLGQQEIKGNQGFKDKDFQEKISECGWLKGQAWCAYFAELAWKEAYRVHDKEKVKILNKLFSAGAVKTYNNFRKSDFIVDKIPEEGSVVIWQNYRDGKPHWTGHAGIVYKIYSDDSARFETIEGNSNSRGGREGIEVAKQLRELNFEPKERGLVLKGFIHPID